MRIPGQPGIPELGDRAFSAFLFLLVGYDKGFDSERAIPWRPVDSLRLPPFLNVALAAAAADSSPVTYTR